MTPPTARHGQGHAHGAITVLNATATGRGCALAVKGGVDAKWTWDDGQRLVWDTPGVDSRLADACYSLLRDDHDAPPGAHAGTHSAMPPARGLKTSSAAAAAMLQAGLIALGKDMDPGVLCRDAVRASIAAGVTLTGAYDDQVAVVYGGCHVTDNAAGRVLATIPIEPWHVAVWVPKKELPKEFVKSIDTSPIRADVEAAEAMLWKGDLPAALTANGAAFSRLYMGAGLPVKDTPTLAALDAGALGAGLSGTGPAVAALFERPVELPPVNGGEWAWTQVAGESP